MLLTAGFPFKQVPCTGRNLTARLRGNSIKFYCAGKLSSIFCPGGRYATCRDRDSWYAMSSAASILLNSTRPSPESPNDLASRIAACASPSADITAAFFCCSACKYHNYN
jgi:hypothetical protein